MNTEENFKDLQITKDKMKGIVVTYKQPSYSESTGKLLYEIEKTLTEEQIRSDIDKYTKQIAELTGKKNWLETLLK